MNPAGDFIDFIGSLLNDAGGAWPFDCTLFNAVITFFFSYFLSKANRLKIVICQSPVYGIWDSFFGRDVYVL